MEGGKERETTMKRCDIFCFFYLLSLLLFNVDAFFAGRKKKDDEIRASVEAGVEMMGRADANTMRDLREMMQDPAMVQEAQKMMKDPAFLKGESTNHYQRRNKQKREYQKRESSPNYYNYISEVEKLKSDPAFLSMMQGQQARAKSSQMGVTGEASEEGNEQLSDAELGLRELGKAARDPKLMQEAMEVGSFSCCQCSLISDNSTFPFLTYLTDASRSRNCCRGAENDGRPNL